MKTNMVMVNIGINKEETDMTETEILQEIRNGGYENSILVWLLNDRIRHINSLEGKNAGLNATITAIRKINKEKNEAIAALCETDDHFKQTSRQNYKNMVQYI